MREETKDRTNEYNNATFNEWEGGGMSKWVSKWVSGQARMKERVRPTVSATSEEGEGEGHGQGHPQQQAGEGEQAAWPASRGEHPGGERRPGEGEKGVESWNFVLY